MAFFGLTTLGPGNTIRDGCAESKTYEFHLIEDERYMEYFSKYLLGDSKLALTLEVDGSCHILKASLGDMLREVMGRQPKK